MQAVTDTQIANYALGFLDDERITNIDADGDTEKLCRLHLPLAKRTLLEEHSWTLARRFKELTPGNPDETRQRNPFLLPTGEEILRLIEIRNSPEPTANVLTFERFGNVIWAESEQCFAVYVANIHVNEMSPLMQNALAWSLAARISQGIGESRNSPMIHQKAQAAIADAWLSDCQQHYSGENSPDFTNHIGVIQARGQGGLYGGGLYE